MVKKFILPLLIIPFLLSGAVQGKTFILFTVPKSGSFLSAKFLGLLNGGHGQFVESCSKDMFNLYSKKFRNGTFNFMHYINQFDVRNYKALFMNVVPILTIRDPRDVCVSSVYYFTNYLDQLCGPGSTFDERLSFVINYPHHLRYFGPQFSFKRAIFLMNALNPVMIRFEDIVGPLGGGDAGRQAAQIIHVANALNIPVNQGVVQYISDHLFGGTPTFREGKIGSWKEEFTAEHIEEFKASPLEQVLLYFGYETSDDW